MSLLIDNMTGIMEDKFTISWKEKISKYHSEVKDCDQLAFANGFSVLYMVIWLLFCIPIALVTTIGKQYVIGFNNSTRTLHLFVRNIWGGAGDKIISIQVSQMQDLMIEKGRIEFKDSNGQQYKLHSVGMGFARKNFPLIGEKLKP